MTHQEARQKRRGQLHRLLGGWPSPAETGANCVDLAEQNNLVIEHLRIESNRPTPHATVNALPGLLTRPKGEGPFPVVLYCHAHGSQYGIGKQELLAGRPALPEGPYASVLADSGIAALCIDQPCFGERIDVGESFLAKQLLWHGDTLFGMMLRELASALDYLQTRTDIDSSRIATCGISMGATTAWWLAALDDRVSAVAQLCCFADIATLIHEGMHDRHGIYMTVPGLIEQFTTAQIARLIAPRPQLICAGMQDTLTPPSAFYPAVDSLAGFYTDVGAERALQVLVDEDSGHVETAGMRQAVTGFLRKELL